MNTYYYEDGTVITRAWSEMECERARLEQNHTPHYYEPGFALYGPYVCPGWNGQAPHPIYDTPPRKPIHTRHLPKRSKGASRTEV